MEKCDYFKDLILTDYIDGQLGKNAVGKVENHLLDCSDCRAFFKEVKNNTAMPFQQVSRQPVPAELWDAIKQGIEGENQVSSPWADFLGKVVTGTTFLKKVVPVTTFPRMVPVFASLILMLLAGSVTLNTIQVQQTQAKDQGEYLVSLLSPGPSSQVDSSDLGTPIEHYFL